MNCALAVEIVVSICCLLFGLASLAGLLLVVLGHDIAFGLLLGLMAAYLVLQLALRVIWRLDP